MVCTCGEQDQKAAGSLCSVNLKADVSFYAFEDAQRVEGVSAGHSGQGDGDHKHSLCLSCGLFCTVSLNNSKITAERGIPPSFCLNLTASLLLVFDLKTSWLADQRQVQFDRLCVRDALEGVDNIRTSQQGKEKKVMGGTSPCNVLSKPEPLGETLL